ncbi:MAG: CehA/McbA family metallohydrolase, partial [Acidobacteria bacterium]|nr:CehA/McbA family metallohydrolase [Acidobacteriota bacterium]
MILLALFWSAALQADAIPILDQPVHLRSGAEREWDDFPEQAAGPALRLTFAAQPNASEYALSLRQRDVKSATWTVRLNGRALGALAADERDMRALLVVPPGALHAGANTLEIATASGRVPDDIEIREARLYPQPVRELLREATVSVDAGELPVKITVVDSSGALMPLAPLGDPAREAVRTGVVYTASGRTRFGLPAGDYRIFASRGWEYDAPSQPVRLRAGQSGRVQLRLHREVTLPGYVSIDTHVHTLELSGHGDAAVRERILTAAAEALDIVVATEHNRTSDYSQAARELGLERLLLPVRGMEVTTATGHFNVFPLPREAPAPEVRERDWLKLARSIQDMPGGRVIIQNHPRDLHSNYRPFDPSHHLSSAGENLNGRPVFANAMEVVNSGAMQSDILQPVRDWLGLLNRGYRVAAIGASDTHTVDFVPIGQARTYIDIRGLGPEWRSRQKELFERLARGENLVAYGLAANLRVVHQSRRKLDLEAAVYGPSWSASDRLTIY